MNNPFTYLPFRSDLANPHVEWLKRFANDGFQGYHISITYIKAERTHVATSWLSAVVPSIFTTLIGKHWQRAAERGDFFFAAYLDEPGSRERASPLPLDAIAEDYHHHGILFVRPPLDRKLETILPPSLGGIDLRGYIPSKFAKHARRLKTCFIQKLATRRDVKRAASYVTKSLPKLSRTCPDDAFQVFP